MIGVVGKVAGDRGEEGQTDLPPVEDSNTRSGSEIVPAEVVDAAAK